MILSFLGAPHWGWALSSTAAPRGHGVSVDLGRDAGADRVAARVDAGAGVPHALSAGLGLARRRRAAWWPARPPRCYLALRTPLTLAPLPQSNRTGDVTSQDAFTQMSERGKSRTARGRARPSSRRLPHSPGTRRRRREARGEGLDGGAPCAAGGADDGPRRQREHEGRGAYNQ